MTVKLPPETRQNLRLQAQKITAAFGDNLTPTGFQLRNMEFFHFEFIVSEVVLWVWTHLKEPERVERMEGMWSFRSPDRFRGIIVERGRFLEAFLLEESRSLYADGYAEIIKGLWNLDMGRQALEDAGLVNTHDKIELALTYRDRLARLEQ